MLEAGGSDRRLFVKIPAGFRMTVGDPRVNWGYRTAPGAQVGGRQIDFPRGRLIGGSSSINGHLYVRGQAADYDHWAKLGCRGWSYDDVLPYFMKAETRARRRPGMARQRRPAGDLRPARPAPAVPGLLRGRGRLRPAAESRTTTRATQEGSCLYQQMIRNGPALECRRRLSAPGAAPRQTCAWSAARMSRRSCSTASGR